MPHPIVVSKNFGFNMLKQQLSLFKNEKVYFSEFFVAYKGDYWRASAGFLGPVIEQSAMKMFKDRFVSRNTLLEVVSTVSDAFLKSPNWYIEKGGEKLTDDAPEVVQPVPVPNNNPEPDVPPIPNPAPIPTPEDTAATVLKAKKDLIDKLMQKFWDKHNLEQKLQKAFNSRLVCGRGGLRVYIPNSRKNKLKNLTLEDFRTALDTIRIEYIEPEQSRMLDDEGDKLSVVSYNKRLDYDTDTDVEVIEFSFVDDNGLTFIGIVTANETKTFTLDSLIKTSFDKRKPSKKDISTELNLDAEPSFFEIAGEPFVSEQFMQLSSFYNLVLTLAAIAVFETGFQEIITTNTKFEYKKVFNPEKNEWEEVPIGLKRGGGVVQNFKGIEKVNLETGVKDFTNPQVTIKEPVQFVNFDLAAKMAYRAILEEASQQYKLISGDANASAVSRIQAMAAFYLRIKKYKADIDALGSWVLTSILKFIGLNASNGLDDYRVIFDSKIDIGPLTVEDKRFILQMVKEGIISKETARVLLNIDNPQLEKLLVDNEAQITANKAFEAAQRQAVLTPVKPPSS